MIDVFLEGKLGSHIGKKWSLKARNAVEVLRALQANTGNFLGESIKSKDNYVVLVDGKPVEGHTSMYKKIQKTLHIVPILGGGLVFVPAFVAAVQAVGAWLALHWAAYWGFAAVTQVLIAGTIVIGGIALISYGIAMLVKTMLGDNDQTGPFSTSSFIFSGAQNVSGQDIPVPIAYGRMQVGSRIISSAISSLDKKIHEVQKGFDLDEASFYSMGKNGGLIFSFGLQKAGAGS